MDQDTINFITSQNRELKQDLLREIRNGQQVLNLKVDQVLERNERLSGSLGRHRVKLQKLDEQTAECIGHKRAVDKIVKKWKLMLVILVVGIYALHNIMEFITISQIVNMFIN